MKQHLLVLWAVLFFDISIAVAQPADKHFQHLSIEQGLSQNSVLCMLQDQKGFLWFGTEDGLNRYDGYQFKLYKNNAADPKSLSQNFVFALHEDREGMLWVGTWGGGLNRFDPATGQFTRYEANPKKPHSINDNFVKAIYEDRAGILWIGTRDGGLNRLDRTAGRFTQYTYQPKDSASLSNNYVLDICEDRSGALWIGTRGGGLNRLNRSTGKFIRYNFQPEDPNSLSNNYVWKIYEDPQGLLWLGTGGGLCRFLPSTNNFVRYRLDEKVMSANVVTCLYQDKQSTFWVGTYGGGVSQFDKQKGTFQHFRHSATDANSLSDDDIFSMGEDRSGAVWFGTMGGGVNWIDRNAKPFAHVYQHPQNTNSLNNNSVFALYEDPQGILWVGTKGGGLNRFDRKNSQWSAYMPQVGNPKSLSNDIIYAIHQDYTGILWLGTDGGGLNRFDPQTGQTTRYLSDPTHPEGLSSNLIYTIVEDATGALWLGTYGKGISRLDKDRKTFRHYKNDPANPNSLGSNYIHTLYLDQRGLLWVGTEGGGLDVFDEKKGTFQHYTYQADNLRSLSSNNIFSVLEDREGNIWVGTQNAGLDKLDRKRGEFIHFREENGLPNNVIYGIQEDNEGNLWLSTNKGLSKFNPRTLTFKNYDVRDGLQSNEFNSWAYYKNKRGVMFFGGVNGFNHFYPHDIRDNAYLPSVYVTDFQVLNKSVRVWREEDTVNQGFALEKEITETKEITLSHSENIFSFEFAALNFTLPEKNSYAYRLEGFEKDWVSTGNRRFVTYTNLDPGTYVFRVKASNNDGVWNEKGTAITIRVKPPFWRTWWAYFLYVLLVAGILYALWRYTIARERLRNALRLERLESEKLMEMDQMKTRFFANISHEFRTPLTLITGPLDKILKESQVPERFLHDCKLMYRNAQRLLQLINQLLDISKLEAGGMKLQVEQSDVAQFVRVMVLSFSSLAESRRIAFRFHYDDEPIQAYFDKDKLEKVVCNLLSNAFKFTPEGGEIEVSVSLVNSVGLENDLSHRRKNIGGQEKWYKIEIRDSGMGIPEGQLQKIFDRFYQVDDSRTREREGTGIGLALTKELVNAQYGEITVSSEWGKGTRFTVLLPLGKAHLRPEDLLEVTTETQAPAEAYLFSTPEESLSPEQAASPEDHRPLLLIVEDNTDVRNLIRSNFEANYRIAEAKDGQEGYDTAVEIIPDLVISDLMMPKMDGVELCTHLKTDERTSHIPVILLTARATGESKMEGLASGADDYLVKPFSATELQVRVRNLIEQRRKLKERFSRALLLQPKEVIVNSADEKFLRKALAVVEANLSNADFGVEEFGREIGMSRVQLHRKLKALTDQTSSDFIRTMRLKKAATLLAQHSGNVAEIAYEVGFNNLSYFAKCFREQYGQLPSEYIARQDKIDQVL